MKTDAELLLGLLGDDCCCERAGEPVPAESQPDRPQMLGKKLPPLTVLTPDAPFVPALYPERESPQLPQPMHAPGLTLAPHAGEYTGVRVPGERGYQTGLLLDSGEIDPTVYHQIDHQTRQARTYSGTDETTAAYTLTTSKQASVFAATQTFLNALNSAAGPNGETPYSGEQQLASGSGTASGSAAGAVSGLENAYVVRLPVGVYARGKTVRERFAVSVPVNLTLTRTFAEAEGRSFAGNVLAWPVLSAQRTDVLSGTEASGVIEAALSRTSSLNGSTESYGGTALQFTPQESSLRWLIVSYTSLGQAYRDYFVYTTGAVATGTYSASWYSFDGVNQPQHGTESISPAFAGAVIGEQRGVRVGDASDPPPRSLSGNFKEVDPLMSNLPCTYQGDPNATYSGGPSYRPVYVALPVPLPKVTLPGRRPTFTVRSPLRLGHSFEIHLPVGVETGQDDLTRIEGRYEVWIDGALYGDTWDSWAAVEQEGRTTLLLDRAENLTVVPDLDVGRATVTPWGAVLADLHLSGPALALSSHALHHTYPEDRAYLLLDTPLRWVAIGPWDAYRNVPADIWRANKLSKPRTRRAFTSAQAAQPPAALPPKPAHGLACWDVYAGLGS